MGMFNRSPRIVQPGLARPGANRAGATPAAATQGVRIKQPSAVVSWELEDYLLYLRSPLRIMWINFLAGIFRGLGAVVGATVVVAALLWLLTLIVSFPVIGEYVRDFHQQVIGFIEETRYSDDFRRIEALLIDIADKTADETQEGTPR